jgi:hypothetical protein
VVAMAAGLQFWSGTVIRTPQETGGQPTVLSKRNQVDPQPDFGVS